MFSFKKVFDSSLVGGSGDFPTITDVLKSLGNLSFKLRETLGKKVTVDGKSVSVQEYILDYALRAKNDTSVIDMLNSVFAGTAYASLKLKCDSGSFLKKLTPDTAKAFIQFVNNTLPSKFDIMYERIDKKKYSFTSPSVTSMGSHEFESAPKPAFTLGGKTVSVSSLK